MVLWACCTNVQSWLLLLPICRVGQTAAASSSITTWPGVMCHTQHNPEVCKSPNDTWLAGQAPVDGALVGANQLLLLL